MERLSAADALSAKMEHLSAADALSAKMEHLSATDGLAAKHFSAIDGPYVAMERFRDPMTGFNGGVLDTIEAFKDPVTRLNSGLLDAVETFRDPMTRLSKELLDAAEMIREPVTRLNKRLLDAAEMIREPVTRLNKGLLDAAEMIREPVTRLNKGVADALETFLGEDRRQWLGLNIHDESIPNFKMARIIAGSGFASVVESMAATNRLDAFTYGAILKEPSRAFTSYMERTGDLARTTSPREREILDIALAFGSTHFRSTSDVVARLLAQESQVSTERMLMDPTTSELALLDLERDELMDRAALDQYASPTKVAEGADTVRLAESIRELLTCVVDCNEAARFRGKDNVFSHTNRSLRASARLPLLLPRDLNCLREAVEHLYFLIYEGAGSDNLRFEVGKSASGVFQRTEDAFAAVMDLKFLRSKWLCHDPEHGAQSDAKTYQTVMRVFQRLGVSGEPASPEDYQKLYLRLVHGLRSFLEELRERLRKLS
jgi:hypothetical protein